MSFPQIEMSELALLLAVTKGLITITNSLSAIFVAALGKANTIRREFFFTPPAFILMD